WGVLPLSRRAVPVAPRVPHPGSGQQPGGPGPRAAARAPPESVQRAILGCHTASPNSLVALRPKVIPPTITHAGVRFGHALLGNADVAVVQFVFAFYGFETYNVLVNPNNLLVQTVLTTMVHSADYVFFVLNTHG